MHLGGSSRENYIYYWQFIDELLNELDSEDEDEDDMGWVMGQTLIKHSAYIGKALYGLHR